MTRYTRRPLCAAVAGAAVGGLFKHLDPRYPGPDGPELARVSRLNAAFVFVRASESAPE